LEGRLMLESVLSPSKEGRRDFARIFFANERKIFIIARGMLSMRPLQPTPCPSSAHIGDLSDTVIERAEALFTESLKTHLTMVSGSSPDPRLLNILRTRAIIAMTVNIGIDFALHMKFLPTFLQPFFLVIVLGEPMQARVATYGFVAAVPNQIKGDRPESKRTPFCVCLLSPNLIALEDESSDEQWEVEYSVRKVSTATIMQVAEMDISKVRTACNLGRWDAMLSNFNAQAPGVVRTL